MTTTPQPPPPTAVILAAGVGSRIASLTDDCPKSLLVVAGMPILERMIRNIEACGIPKIVIVLGYLGWRIRDFVGDRFPHLDVTYVSNPLYRDTNTGYSLMLAEGAIDGTGFVKFDADVVFDAEILRRLIASDADAALCVDRNIQLDAEEVKVVINDGNRVVRVSKTVDPKIAMGESIGIEKVDAATSLLLFGELVAMMKSEDHLQDYYEAAYERLIAGGAPFHAVDITGLAWVEIDTHDDFILANRTPDFSREVQQVS